MWYQHTSWGALAWEKMTGRPTRNGVPPADGSFQEQRGNKVLGDQGRSS